MKKAISLIEVLISITLITLIIGSTLNVQNNSIELLKKLKNSSTYTSYISLLASKEPKSGNQNVYLDDMVDFKDDDIRTELKKYKLKIEEESLSKETIDIGNFKVDITTNQKTITLNDDVTKKYYTIKINTL